MKSAFILLTALLFCSMSAQAAHPLAFQRAADGMAVQKVKPGTLRGIISDADGRKLGGGQILVRDASGNLVGAAVSDEYGIYTIEGLNEGSYLFLVDKEPIARLVVTRNATVTTFMAILPGGAAAAPMKWTLIILGGTAVAVGVPVILHNSDDSSDHPPVSP